MNWREQMHIEATRIIWGAAAPEHDEVRLSTSFDDGYDPTYGGCDPRFSVDLELRLDGSPVETRRMEGEEADDFLRRLMNGEPA